MILIIFTVYNITYPFSLLHIVRTQTNDRLLQHTTIGLINICLYTSSFIWCNEYLHLFLGVNINILTNNYYCIIVFITNVWQYTFVSSHSLQISTLNLMSSNVLTSSFGYWLYILLHLTLEIWHMSSFAFKYNHAYSLVSFAFKHMNIH